MKRFKNIIVVTFILLVIAAYLVLLNLYVFVYLRNNAQIEIAIKFIEFASAFILSSSIFIYVRRYDNFFIKSKKVIFNIMNIQNGANNENSGAKGNVALMDNYKEDENE